MIKIGEQKQPECKPTNQSINQSINQLSIIKSLSTVLDDSMSGFQMTVEKPKPKQLLRQITTGANSAMNQSQILAIICNLLKAREKSRVHGAIGFGLLLSG